ncbi:MAG: hypothetical protein ACI8PT_001430 [Gammaproteobacteria bacterium]|jgi:hypothetical protein
MNDRLLTAVQSTSAWSARDLANDTSWVHDLSEAEIAELDRTLTRVLSAGIADAPFGRAEFPLPQLSKTLARLMENVTNGRGIALIHGIPTERYNGPQLRALYWGIGTYLGQSISQNSRGEMVAEVTDRGNDHNDMNVRGYKTRAALAPHVDSCDMTTLLCVHGATAGGDSLITSSMSVYNAILSERPELLDGVYSGFRHDLRGEGVTGEIDELTTNAFPIFSYFDGVLSCAFNSRIMRSAREKAGPALTPLEDAAIDAVIELAQREALQYRMHLVPGDLQVVNNFSVLHARDAYTDDGSEAQKRTLLRMWYRFHQARTMVPGFGDRYNTGDRGGVAIGDGARYSF